jgi:dihydroorotate dehydrogenase (fumarate)
MNTTTKYMGFELRNPIIAGSSGLTNSVENIIELEKHGAAAIVLKSLFEEQIIYNYQKKLSELKLDSTYPEAEEYITRHTMAEDVEKYLELIRNSKKAVSIPIIASINCVSSSEWTVFAKEIELAGADGIELNIFLLPTDTNLMCGQVEEMYLNIVNEVVKKVSIPVSIKVTSYFSGMARSMLRFSFSGIKGIVLFNRFYSTDIDIENLKTIQAGLYSTPNEIYHPLRWIALLSDRIYCDIAGSTGIHDGQGLVKILLAGAKAGQVCSALYQQGFPVIGKMLNFLEDYMKRKGFNTMEDLIGKMSLRNVENPASYERVQFMKHYSGIE